MVKEKQKQPKPEKTKPELYQSQTVVIKRNQINLHPRNPKRHSDDAIKQQRKNFKDIGFLGGLIWNANTGNLVSGHKRIAALDLYYGNTTETPINYDVKVERVELTEKQELEQLVYMDARSANTQQDYDLLALLLPDLDYKLAGLTSDELNLISIESPMMDIAPMKEIKSDFQELGKSQEEKKAAIKEAKQKIKDSVAENQGETYVSLSFDSYENKCAFMERFGFANDLRFIKGESFSDLIIRNK